VNGVRLVHKSGATELDYEVRRKVSQKVEASFVKSNEGRPFRHRKI